MTSVTPGSGKSADPCQFINSFVSTTFHHHSIKAKRTVIQLSFNGHFSKSQLLEIDHEVKIDVEVNLDRKPTTCPELAEGLIRRMGGILLHTPIPTFRLLR